MGKQIYDIDTVGFNYGVLGSFFDFYINNTFYLLAPEYYRALYSIYYSRCLTVYDGWVANFHDIKSGLVPQRMLQSVATGLNNMLFSNGIDFSGDNADYLFATKWGKKSKFLTALKKAHKFAIAGGTSLLKLNRQNKELFATAHRIDTFFVDVDASGRVVSGKIFFDAIHNTNPTGTEQHYGLAEERYFNKENKACVKTTIYRVNGNLQTAVNERPQIKVESVAWESLPKPIKEYIKDNYPDILIDKEQYLPFRTLGLYLMKFTDDIPQIPNLPFGQPIGDILFTENFQYDQMKYFEKNEVDLARARALVPEEMWNKDDPAYEQRALSERFYQKVSSMGNDNDKLTPIQFLLRGDEIRLQKENIYKDIAFKLNVSASSVASFLNEGAGAKTATEIVNEKTKSDTWLKGQINLNEEEINCLLKDVMFFYNYGQVEIIFKVEDQSPFLETLKTNSDVFNMGNMSARRFVKDTYKHLSQGEQEEEIRILEETKANKDQMQQATMQSWNKV